MSELRFFHAPFEQLTLMQLHDVFWLRNEVFVVGQKITSEPEVDGLDPQCVHVVGVDETGRTVATARLFMDADPIKVGRIAVARDLQGRGLGTELMHYVHAVMNGRPGAMSAQDYLRKWYASLGWIADSDVYDEAGIPHVHMSRPGI